MNGTKPSYASYELVKEMMQTVQVASGFDAGRTKGLASTILAKKKLFLTGEGSSRIFPAKNLMRKAMTLGLDVQIATDASRQAASYNLKDFVVFCASNSGRTKEVVLLASRLKEAGHKHCYGLTANPDTLLESACQNAWVLDCGWEQAVAATKSVVEQGLFYESILWNMLSLDMSSELAALPSLLETALTLEIPKDIVEKAVQAPTIYFAGYNDGVAEELTLKTNEITRKKSDFLEGTYAIHGIEEVMQANDIVFVVDPIDEEIEKFQEVLSKGVGLTVVAIADRDTLFPTIKVPTAGSMSPYVYLCAGWNLLVEIGLAKGIDLDKPDRARKVGNEYVVPNE